jgi:hypothetical protein
MRSFTKPKWNFVCGCLRRIYVINICCIVYLLGQICCIFSAIGTIEVLDLFETSRAYANVERSIKRIRSTK